MVLCLVIHRHDSLSLSESLVQGKVQYDSMSASQTLFGLLEHLMANVLRVGKTISLFRKCKNHSTWESLIYPGEKRCIERTLHQCPAALLQGNLVLHDMCRVGYEVQHFDMLSRSPYTFNLLTWYGKSFGGFLYYFSYNINSYSVPHEGLYQVQSILANYTITYLWNHHLLVWEQEGSLWGRRGQGPHRVLCQRPVGDLGPQGSTSAQTHNQ